MAEPWFLIPVDAINGMRSTGQAERVDGVELAAILRRTRLGYHRVVAALASVGNDVVMDYPLSERWRLDDLLDVLQGFDVTVVEVRCAPEELERRERARGDRPTGLARSQIGVHAHGECDIAIDTTNTSPEACAKKIIELLSEPQSGLRAFDRLRAAGF